MRSRANRSARALRLHARARAQGLEVVGWGVGSGGGGGGGMGWARDAPVALGGIRAPEQPTCGGSLGPRTRSPPPASPQASRSQCVPGTAPAGRGQGGSTGGVAALACCRLQTMPADSWPCGLAFHGIACCLLTTHTNTPQHRTHPPTTPCTYTRAARLPPHPPARAEGTCSRR